MATNSSATAQATNLQNASKSGCPCKFEDTTNGAAKLAEIEAKKREIANLKAERVRAEDRNSLYWKINRQIEFLAWLTSWETNNAKICILRKE